MTNNEINIIENFLSEDECSEIILKFKNGQDINIDDFHKRIEDTLNENYKFKGFKFKKLNPLILKEYTTETKYSLEWKSNENSYFTIIIQLNNDFKNGYQQFSIADEEFYLQVPKNIGNMTVFFSNLMHRLAPVKIGVKYTLETEIEITEIPNYNKTLL